MPNKNYNKDVNFDFKAPQISFQFGISNKRQNPKRKISFL